MTYIFATDSMGVFFITFHAIVFHCLFCLHFVGRADESSSVSDSAHLETSLSSSTSTSSSRRPTQDTTTRRPHAVLERSCKDLHRQTVSLERLRVVLGDNVDRAFKRVNEVFRELHEQSVSRYVVPVFNRLKVKRVKGPL